MFKEGLKRTNEFKKVFSNGNRKSGKYLILYILSSQQENNRAGFIVKKSLGNAVQRNKIKRRLREIWRQKGIKLIFGCDVIIVAKKEILEASFTEIEQELIRLLPRDNFKIR